MNVYSEREPGLRTVVFSLPLVEFLAMDERAACAQRQAEEHARKQAVEKRRQELHRSKVLLAEAEVDHRVMLNMNLQASEHRIMGGPERIIEAQKMV
ncbi:MAG TPA: hypothetical protein VH601_11310 [Bryobacteraceae bacterium]|jgi:DNA-binding protein H-NS